MYVTTSRDYPKDANKYETWLQVLDGQQWYSACELRPYDARYMLRWLDRHPLCKYLRLEVVKVGV